MAGRAIRLLNWRSKFKSDNRDAAQNERWRQRRRPHRAPQRAAVPHRPGRVGHRQQRDVPGGGHLGQVPHRQQQRGGPGLGVRLRAVAGRTAGRAGGGPGAPPPVPGVAQSRLRRAGAAGPRRARARLGLDHLRGDDLVRHPSGPVRPGRERALRRHAVARATAATERLEPRPPGDRQARLAAVRRRAVCPGRRRDRERIRRAHVRARGGDAHPAPADRNQASAAATTLAGRPAGRVRSHPPHPAAAPAARGGVGAR